MEKTVFCTTCNAALKVSGPVDNSKIVTQPVTCLVCETPNEVEWSMNSGYQVTTRCPDCDGNGKIGIPLFESGGLHANAGGRKDCARCKGTGELKLK